MCALPKCLSSAYGRKIKYWIPMVLVLQKVLNCVTGVGEFKLVPMEEQPALLTPEPALQQRPPPLHTSEWMALVSPCSS